MRFNNKFPEKILVTSEDGEYGLIQVDRSKMSVKSRLESTMNSLIADKGYKVNFGGRYVNLYDEIFNFVPMLCNFISSQKVEKVLFVGDHDMNNKHWVTEASNHPTDFRTDVVDMNIISQFIPIILKEYAYDIEVVVVKPMQNRYNGLMTDLYESFGIKVIRSMWPYRHGMRYLTFKNNEYENYFDSVVFANIHMTDNCSSFQLAQIEECFGQLLTDDCRVIDMLHDKQSKKRLRYLFNGENKLGVESGLNEALETRRSWDRDLHAPINARVYNFLDRFISLYNLGDMSET